MVEAARVKLRADVHRPTGVRPKVADVAQRDAAARRAGAWWLHTPPQVIEATNIVKETQILLLEEVGLTLVLLEALLTLGLRQF